LQQLEFIEDGSINDEEQQWAKRFANRNNFGFADSDDDDDWESPDETYVVFWHFLSLSVSVEFIVRDF